MANERLAGLTIGMDMETAGIERSVTSIKRSFRGLESSVKTSTNNMRYGERTVENYKSNIETLSGSIEKQEKNVSDLGKQYESLSDEQKQSVKGVNLAREYNKQADELNRMNHMMDNYRSELKQIEGENTVWYKAGEQLQDYGSGLKDVGGQMQSVGRGMTNKITKPAGFAAGAVGGIVTAFGWERLSSLDTAQAQLKGLGYSTEEVGEISDTVTDAIDGGMTTMAEGTKVAAGAMAAGVDEGKDLERYIKLVGDAAVGANRPVEEMSMIFNRVQGEGKLMTRELNMIEQAMPGFSQAMADHVADGSLSAFKEMVTNGEVGSDEFLDVMEDFSGGMAEEYSKNWSGMVENTKAYIGQIGEAFLQGVFEDSKKSLADFIDLLKSDSVRQKATEMGETARDVFANMKDAIVGVVEWYTNLDDWQKTLIKRLGLVAFAAGPVIESLGKLTKGTGAVMNVVGGLAKAIGLEGGAGLVGTMGGLTKAGVVGLAIAGVGGLVYGVKKLHDHLNETEEVSLDTTHALSDQAEELDKNVGTFDKLSEKAKLSNEELAEMYDLNERISESSNSTEINQLQEQYDKLAEKSGLSKEEIEKLFGANEHIIEQSEEVESSVSKQGNEFVESTEAVKEYVAELYEMSRQELSDEMVIAQEKKTELLKENKQHQKELNDLDEQSRKLRELDALSEEERQEKLKEWHRELQQQLADKSLSQEEYNDLKDEEEIVNGYINEGIGEGLDKIKGQRKELNEKVEKNDEELEKINQLDEEMSNIYLKQAGINEEGSKGLATLDEKIETEQKDIEKLEQKRQKNGELTEEDRKQLEKLKEKLDTHESTREKIFEQTGQANELNDVIDNQIDGLKGTNKENVERLIKATNIKDEEGNIYDQIVKQNEKFDDQIAKAETEYEKGKINKTEYQNQVKELENKKGNNTEIIDQILKSIGLNGDERKKIIESNDALSSQDSQIGENNRSTSRGIRLEEDRTFEAGKKADKKININPSRDIDDFNDDVGMTKDKKIRLAANPVGTKFSMPLLQGYAKGTGSKGHPGGAALVNDGTGSNAGSELIQTPDGSTGMMKGKNVVANLPKGSHVWSAKQTNSILKGMPGYAKGTGASVDVMWKGITKKGLMAMTASKIMSSAASLVSGGISGITGGMLDVIKNHLTTNPKKVVSVGGGGAKPNFDYPITSGFGPRGSPGGIGSSDHKGVDFGFPHGTNVPAQTGGKVTKAGGYGGYGNAVMVKSGDMEVLYAHLSSVAKKVGDTVSKGDSIGKSGNTGNSTGPHLHYEVRRGGKAVDPMSEESGGLSLGSAVAGSNAKGGSGVSRWRSTAAKALKMEGEYNSANLNALMKQMRSESSGNPSTVNTWDINARRGTPSKGLMQVIDPTFKAYKRPGHNDIMNPLDNILASIRYARKRYGSLTAAYRGVGYKQGTNYVPQDGPAMLHKGEAVIPKEFNQPAKRTSATKLLALVGKQLQKEDKSEQRQTHTDAAQTAALQQQNAILQQQTNILMQLLQKDNNVYLDGDDITNNVNQKNALAAIGKHF